MRSHPPPRTHGGHNPTDLDAVDCAREVLSLGAGEILLTSIDCDGTRQSFELQCSRSRPSYISYVPGAASITARGSILTSGARHDN
jgi:cyclase